MRIIFVVMSLLSVSGCKIITDTVPPYTESAKVIEAQGSASIFDELPQPAGKIPVAVYAFRDQTGQYKPSTGASSFSTAVTQGATSVLVQSLSRTDWFLPVEREGLQNIITERKIIRAANEAENKPELPPLTTARIIIEGGIISYDSNIRTGGMGAEYFGVGASELFREDQIAIYMRAIDVRTGQVLVSVSTSKKVLSQEVRAGVFRYVSFRRLLEAEMGYTTNEPMFECVKQGIDKALSELVVAGIDKGVWRSKA